MKRRTLFALPVVSMALLLTACGGSSSSSSSSSSQKKTMEVYTTKVTSVKVMPDDSDWKITGTTDAPDGSKIAVTRLSDDPLDMENSCEGIDGEDGTGNASWPKVKNGKFTALVDAIDLVGDPDNYTKVGYTQKAAVVAISNYSKSWPDGLTSKAAKAINKANPKTVKFTLSSSQVKYIDSLDDDDSSDKSSSSSSSSSSKAKNYRTDVSYDSLARDPKTYKGEYLQYTGEVMQVLEDDSYTDLRIAVNGNYDDVLYVELDNSILHGKRILEDDLVTVKGVSAGIISYKATSGTKISIPGLAATEITDSGTAPDDYGE